MGEKRQQSIWKEVRRDPRLLKRYIRALISASATVFAVCSTVRFWKFLFELPITLEEYLAPHAAPHPSSGLVANVMLVFGGMISLLGLAATVLVTLYCAWHPFAGHVGRMGRMALNAWRWIWTDTPRAAGETR